MGEELVAANADLLARLRVPDDWRHAGQLHAAQDAARAADARVEALSNLAADVLWLAEHLFQMISRETWRATGGDDGQGHYEGDYRAEFVETQLQDARAALRVPSREGGQP
jgi:hypothetical protein